MTIVNNIVSGMKATSTQPYGLQIGGTATSLGRADIKNNIFYDGGTNTRYRVGVWPDGGGTASWTTYPTYSALCAAYSAFCTGSSENNPDHVDPVNGDFHLKLTSPAINAGALHSAYATFQGRYGISIEDDFDNKPRPDGIANDIGSYEYLPPSAPANVRIVP